VNGVPSRGRDEKILTSWNGLMLRSFAEASRYPSSRPDYLQVAINNATFLLSQLRQDGRLLRTYKNGRARLNGYLEDYTFLADGCSLSMRLALTSIGLRKRVL